MLHEWVEYRALKRKAVIKTAIHKGDLVMKIQRLTSILGSSLVAGALAIGAPATTQSASAQSNTAVGQANDTFRFPIITLA
jgi:hypothetical protein